jgi:hypothetical protein
MHNPPDMAIDASQRTVSKNEPKENKLAAISSGRLSDGVSHEQVEQCQTLRRRLILGVFPLLSPWIVGYSGPPVQNALISGLVIAGLSVATLAAFAQWEE